MLTAYNEHKERILAQHAQKDMCYFCPVCEEQMVLKQGRKNIAHFAHSHQCHHQGTGETALHCKLKAHIYHVLSRKYHHVQLEPYLSEIQQIPDIVVNNTALEIQLSVIPVEQMRQRTECLVRAGYHVIWLTMLPRYRQGVYVFNQLQQACIHPKRHMMYGIHPTTYQLYRLRNLMSITARQFVADCEEASYAQLVEEVIADLSEMMTVRKLATVRILRYLMYCRRKDSVHEPTLSAMYRMQLSDEQVVQLTGFIFPEQLYIYTHPVLWQLKVLEALSQQGNPYEVMRQCLKFRQFAIGNVSQRELTAHLIERYKKILKL
ncbi:competence protein CoiA [Staphylococcus americanisciuri]|uniref:Competence protein CoiA family protein n=1 Tax=Staphylococcus americanisciuri TaxID=2973940 RepID=A0ABT2F2I4_9STAP|nr:competence protein CoiA family protein [Staphylococcus americanisciuri]MCS4486622.1 competence protein CoiA family protein [Staphylococcus americanisciuri]